MKNILITFFMGAFFLSACSSNRVIPYPYDDVVSAAKEKFAINEWTEFYTKESSVKEKPRKKIIFTHYYWSFPEPKITCIVEMKRNEDGFADTYVFVRDWCDWFSPLTYSPSTAKKVLETMHKRMETGSWEELPWEQEDKLK
jgi:hypothetical protein